MPNLTDSSRVKFSWLCDLMADIRAQTGATKARVFVEKCLNRFSRQCDMFPLLRLLIPAADRERTNYHVKEASLAKLFSEILAVKASDRERLKNYKDPSKQPLGKAGDFVSVLSSVLEGRLFHSGPSATVAEVNGLLDQMAAADDVDTRKSVLLQAVKKLSNKEAEEFVRICLKDLRLGIGHESILKRLHPDALKLYNMCTDLKRVCAEAAAHPEGISSVAGRGGDGEGGEGGEQAEGGGSSAADPDTLPVFFFCAMRPMLARPLEPSKRPITEALFNPNLEAEDKRYFCETKFDGERLLVHVDRRRPEGDQIAMFSRNGSNYTDLYGPSISPHILSGFRGLRGLLDGEILGWDEATQTFLPFGTVKSVAIAANANRAAGRRGEEDQKLQRHLVFVAFDLVFFQSNEMREKGEKGLDLTGTGFEQRRRLLMRALEEKPPYLRIAESTLAESTAQIEASFEAALKARDEGIVVKRGTAPYMHVGKGAAQRDGWWKMKPSEGTLGDTLDLLCVGGFVADGMRRRDA
eukprot:Cvel_30784.t1-p1 / transcript=Cvel_30784.t1 / gene=Cvel_30784 / organism=Chromera_velia_CCMP2878 / gene_product=DNA ligase 4, putative / transcript_product=DNA ligase 4, putative / location=Cvel_scaffold4451:3702-9050(+) / protein_length=523 / sequence_SO=supercontig / SO=protein_coding / is_pseudo=false